MNIFDTDILSHENDNSGLMGLQGLDKENPLEYILSDNDIQLNTPYKIKHILEYNKENGGILYLNNKRLYFTLVCIISNYTNNAVWPSLYKEVEKEINNFWLQLLTFNKEDFKNYIIPLEKLLQDKTCPEYIYFYQ